VSPLPQQAELHSHPREEEEEHEQEDGLQPRDQV